MPERRNTHGAPAGLGRPRSGSPERWSARGTGRPNKRNAHAGRGDDKNRLSGRRTSRAKEAPRGHDGRRAACNARGSLSRSDAAERRLGCGVLLSASAFCFRLRRLAFVFGVLLRLRRFAFGFGVLLRLRRFAAASAFCFGSVPCPALDPLSRGRGGRGRLPVPPGRCGRRWRSLPPPQSGAPRGRPCPTAWPR